MPEPHRSVFTGRMPFLPPNQQRQSTEGIKKKSNKGINNTLADTTELNYKKQANKASKAVRSAKRDFEHKTANNIKNGFKIILYLC